MLPSHKTCFHHELLFLKNMLMELCASNYATLDGFVNGADSIFQDYKNNSEPLIWIYFHNLEIEINTRIL
jgi:hypothetical protein